MAERENKRISTKVLQNVLVVLLFCAGLGIRLYDLTDLPMDFHPTRQYHSAVIARGLYERWGGQYPEEEIPLIRAQEASEARIEPPIFEYLTAVTFLLVKSDALWIPRLYAILFWLAGGVPLYLLTKKHLGFAGGIVGLGFFLLVPFGVYASRSFQPDPLMISLCIFSIWAMDRWREGPTWKMAIVTGLLMGAAILVKQVTVLFLPVAFIALAWAGSGFRQMIRNRQVWVIGILAILPAAVYNLYGIFISRTLAGQYSERFFPELWVDPGFYNRWSNMIQDTIGLPIFILSLLGLLLIPKSSLKTILTGYGIGYVLYGFAFAHHISTHNYYQLTVFPLIAAGIGAAANSLFAAIRKVNPVRAGTIWITLIMLAATMLCLWEARSTLKREDYRSESILLAELSAEMGGAGTKTIGLMDDYGAALYYYGFILPEYWVSEEDGVMISSMNEQEVEALFENRAAGKKYFILSDFKTMETQPLVLEYLDSHFTIFYEDERYRIYDLKKPLEQTGLNETDPYRALVKNSGAVKLCW